MGGLLTFAILTMKFFPDTPSARRMHFYLIDEPIRLVAQVERKHLIFAVLMIGMVIASETIAMLGSLDLATVMVWDTSVFLDVVATCWTVAAVARSRSGYAGVKTMVLRIAGRPRRALADRRQGGQRPRAAPANDDDDDHRTVAIAA